MMNRMRIFAFLLVIFSLACDSTGNSKFIYPFNYIGTLRDGGTVQMIINVECSSKEDMTKIEKNISTIKRALSMTLVRQKTENLRGSGKNKIQNSLYKIIEQFSGASFNKISIHDFKMY